MASGCQRFSVPVSIESPQGLCIFCSCSWNVLPTSPWFCFPGLVQGLPEPAAYPITPFDVSVHTSTLAVVSTFLVQAAASPHHRGEPVLLGPRVT